MNLKEIFNECKTDPCISYIVNKLGNKIGIVPVDNIMEIRDKKALVDIIECIYKLYLTQSTVKLEDFLRYTID